MSGLAKIDAKISEKRRNLQGMIAERSDLFEQLDAVAEAIDALEAVEGELNAEQSAELEAHFASHKTITKQASKLGDNVRKAEGELHDLEAQRADRVEHNRQAAGGNLPRQTGDENPAPRSPAADVRVADLTPAQQDHDLASFFRNSYIAKQHGCGVLAVCNGQAGADFRNDRLYGAMTTSGSPHVIPENYQPRLIELLRARSVIRSLPGVLNLPLLNGNLRIPRQSGASTANYVAEQAYIPLSTPTTDQISLAAKKLTVMVVQSGELMRRSNPTTDRMILDDIVKTLALKEDITFLRATGSATVPEGLKLIADGAAQVVTANATVNLANVTTDLGYVLLMLANADCPFLNPAWIFHPRIERFLMDMRDGNGNLAFPEMNNGFLRGVPYKTTTQVPTNLTGSGGVADTEIYLVDASELIIADAPTYELQVSTEAAYDDGGTVKAAFSNDSAVFRLIVEHDIAMRHDESVAYMEEVTWGV